MSVFPADQPLSRTWSEATQMAWETAKVSRPFFTLICPPLLYPLLLDLSSPSIRSPSFLERPFPSSLLSPLCPVCSALTIHSFRLIHPSVPLGTHPLLSFPPLLLWPPGQSTVVSSWAKTGPFLTNRFKNTPQTVSCTQGRCLTRELSESSFRNSKQSLLSSNL